MSLLIFLCDEVIPESFLSRYFCDTSETARNRKYLIRDRVGKRKLLEENNKGSEKLTLAGNLGMNEEKGRRGAEAGKFPLYWELGKEEEIF